MANTQASYDDQAFDDDAVLHTSWPSDNEVLGSNPISRAGVKQTPAESLLEVVWSGGQRQEYPYVWLRDHCRCSFCFHAHFQTRVMDFMDLNLDLAIKSIDVIEEGKSISISWCDDHVSRFKAQWLLVNRFDKTCDEPVSSIEPVHWGSSIWGTNHMTKFIYQDVMLSDETLREMLAQLKSVGVVLIKESPKEKGHVSNLSTRIGYIANTSYGFTSNIYGRAEWAFGHPSYGLEYRPLHTDYSFCNHPPGVVLMHCIDQIKAEGGEYFFSDGFRAADELRRSDPKSFGLLTKACWESRVKGWVTNDKHYHYSRLAPISLNDKGEVFRIVLTEFWRTGIMRIPVDQVTDTYRALRALYDNLYREDCVIHHSLEPGDVLIFNNHRVVHGRKEYIDAQPSQVHLETCYFDWDSVDSRLRKLAMALGPRSRQWLDRQNGKA